MFGKLKSYFMILFLIILFILLLLSTIILADFIGVVSIRSKIPKKYLDNKIVEIYIKKSRFLHKNIDEQVRERTLEKEREYDLLIEKYNGLINEFEKKRLETEKLKADALRIKTQAEAELEKVNKNKSDFSKMMKDYEDREKRIEEQSMMYSKMDALRAAEILSSLENSLVISIIRKMGEKKAAKIIESMEPKRAAEILKEMSR